jgi:hypothetical protein
MAGALESAMIDWKVWDGTRENARVKNGSACQCGTRDCSTGVSGRSQKRAEAGGKNASPRVGKRS